MSDKPRNRTLLTPHKLGLMTGDPAETADFLVCDIVGDPRLPASPGDRDETGTCACGTRIVFRASAPPGPTRICRLCWKKMVAEGIAE